MGLFDFLKKNKNIENDNGLNEIYTNNGKGVLREKFYRKNGKIDGLYEFYDVCVVSGQHLLKKVGKFKNGQKDGVWKEYRGKSLEMSYLIREVNYKEGKLHGISKSIEIEKSRIRMSGDMDNRFPDLGDDEAFERFLQGKNVNRKARKQLISIKNYKNGEILDQKSHKFVKADKNEIILGELR